MTEILFMGPTNSGKSLLLKRMQALSEERRLTPFDPIPNTVPTEGWTQMNFKTGGNSYIFKELGGSSIRDWESLARTAKAIIYVFDAADLTRTASNIVWLNEILQSHLIEDKPILVVLSKCDVPDCIRFSTIDEIIGFDHVLNPSRLALFETSSVVGVGLSDIFHWISRQMK